MYVEIHAQSTEGSSRGKKQWAQVHQVEGALELHVPYKGTGMARPWAMTIRGASTNVHGNGARLGKPVEIESRVLVELSPDDVVAIVGFALRHGLVRFEPSAGPSQPI